jgi:peptide/nickel transport system permease protein
VNITATATLDSPEPVSSAPPEPRHRRRKPSWGLWLGVTWLSVLTFLAIFADQLPFIRPTTRVRGAGNFAYGPGQEFWFGSDQLGRDVFARCIYGAQISLRIAVFSILTGLVVGGGLGLAAGYFRGWVDRLVSTIIDVLLAFPALIIALLIVQRTDALSVSYPVTFGWLSRTWAITFVLALLAIAPLARIVRAQTMSLREREFVLAARSVGASSRRIILREILPNLVPAMLSVLFIGVAVLLVAEGALAFLGYSVKSPTPTWGLLVSESRQRIGEAWWATIMPCLMMFMTVLSFNLIGDRLARRFDIREATL